MDEQLKDAVGAAAGAETGETAGLVVTPLDAASSRTLRRTRLAALWTAALAILPDLVGVGIQLMGEPAIAKLVAGYVPLEARLIIAALVGVYLRGNWKLRMDTARPIAGSIGEAKVRQTGQPGQP